MEEPAAFMVWPASRKLQGRAGKAPREEGSEGGGAAGTPFEDILGDVALDGDDAAKYQEYRELVHSAVEDEVDLDRGILEAASCLPEGEMSGRKKIKRTKVLEALLRRGRSREIVSGVKLDAEEWGQQLIPSPKSRRVARLAHGLESVARLRGKLVPLALLPLPQRRELRQVAQPEDVDMARAPPFVPPSEDEALEALAREASCKFFSSTSSLTGLLGKCHFAITAHRGVDIRGLSSSFQGRSSSHTPAARLGSLVYLRRTADGRAWSISAAPGSPDDLESTVLMKLGVIMEQQLTMPKADFDARFRRDAQALERASDNTERGHGAEAAARDQAYRFLKVGDVLMRSQLDAVLEGRIFDLKTRAVAPVRYDCKNFKATRSYRINQVFGPGRSFELEIYDLMRSGFLKFGLQARIGRMHGILVAYHNTVEIFGFQYISLEDLDRCVHGGAEAARSSFDLSVKLLRNVLELVTGEADLTETGLVKVMFHADKSSGNALDISSAPVISESSDGRDALGRIRRFRVLVATMDPDERPHSPSKPLQSGCYVQLSIREILLDPAAEPAAEAPNEGAWKEKAGSAVSRLMGPLERVVRWARSHTLWACGSFKGAHALINRLRLF